MSTVDIPSSNPATDSGPVPGETCPRCHTTQDWGQSSWCPNCSYYPVVDGSGGGGSSWADNLPDMPQEEVADDRSPLEAIPGWFWGMIGGIVGITAFSVTIRLLFPDDDSPRGIIAIAQLTIGLISMAVAHGIASREALKSDRRLNLNDVALSWFNVWQPTIAQLPTTCRRLLAMAWGAFAVLTAVTIIGGIDYSAPFRTHKAPEVKPMKLIGTVAAAAKAQAGKQPPADMAEALGDLQSEVAGMQEAANAQADNLGPQTMEEALSELGNMDEQLTGLGNMDLENMDTEAAMEEMKSITMNCFIYGVETDSKNVPKAFLFAANTLGTDQHVARILTSDLDKEDFRTIAVQLYTAIQKAPEIETTREAVWVKPIVTCRLSCFGFDENGELKDPKFQAIIVTQRGINSTTSHRGRSLR